jgi:hypothetical protein
VLKDLSSGSMIGRSRGIGRFHHMNTAFTLQPPSVAEASALSWLLRTGLLATLQASASAAHGVKLAGLSPKPG